MFLFTINTSESGDNCQPYQTIPNMFLFANVLCNISMSNEIFLFDFCTVKSVQSCVNFKFATYHSTSQ